MVARNQGDDMPGSKRDLKDGLAKFQRYRLTREREGMRLLRVWVPDPRRPEFVAEAKRQADPLRVRPEQRETLDFIAAAFAWPEASSEAISSRSLRRATMGSLGRR
jgi:hypothetical protein